MKSMMGHCISCKASNIDEVKKKRILDKYPANKDWWPKELMCPAGEVRGSRCDECQCFNNKEK